MENNKRQLFYLLTKKIAMNIHQFGCSTVSSYLDSGWSNSEQVFENALLPILSNSEQITLVGYKPDWKNSCHENELPEWACMLDKLAYKDGKRYFLQNNFDSMKELFDYWQDPSFLIDSKNNFGKETIRPAVPVIEIDPIKVDIDGLMKASEIFSQTSNPWAGGFEAAGRLVKSRIKESENLYLPYRNLSAFRFFGCEKAIERLVDRVMIEGMLIEEIEDHCPGYWEDDYSIQEGESIDQAVDRLLEEEIF
jgi:hypothetical protein